MTSWGTLGHKRVCNAIKNANRWHFFFNPFQSVHVLPCLYTVQDTSALCKSWGVCVKTWRVWCTVFAGAGRSGSVSRKYSTLSEQHGGRRRNRSERSSWFPSPTFPHFLKLFDTVGCSFQRPWKKENSNVSQTSTGLTVSMKFYGKMNSTKWNLLNLPAVAIPLALCVKLEIFTIDAIAGWKEHWSQSLAHCSSLYRTLV